MKVQGAEGYAQLDAKNEWQFYDIDDNAIMSVGKDILPDVTVEIVNMVMGLRNASLNQGANIHANNMNASFSALFGVPAVVQQLNVMNQQLVQLIALLTPGQKKVLNKKKSPGGKK